MKRLQWKDEAKADVRGIDREQAMNILLELTRYAETGQGDVKRLKDSDQFRLRVGTIASASATSKAAACRFST